MSWSKKTQDEVDSTEPCSQRAVAQVSTSFGESIYELPLNEKIRTFIRLETLFDEIEFHLQGNTVWDIRSAINTFIDILSVFSRPEIKTDLIKEMDRINVSLSKYTAMDGVNTGRLQDVRTNLGHMAKELRCMEGQIGQNLKQNDFIMSIRQRDSIPGGALAIDLPSYGHWLDQESEVQKNDIRGWLAEFSLVKKAVHLILELIRGSETVIDVIAKGGFYQHVLDPGTCHQILRVILPKHSAYFPEISGGRQRFTVRFLKPLGFDRPVQIEQDVPFRLICCAL